MQLLWRGIAAYVFHHGIDLMFGCASLPGTDPDALAPELTYLYRTTWPRRSCVRAPCRSAMWRCGGCRPRRSIRAARWRTCRR